MENEANSRFRAHDLAPALLAMLGVVALVPVADILLNALPLRLSDEGWRFQIESQILNAAPQWALILLVVLALGSLAERPGALKAGALLCFVLAAALVVALPLFALDFLTMRKLQPQTRIPSFQRAGFKLAGIGALLVPVLFWGGVRGLRAARKESLSAESAGPALVIGQAPRVAKETVPS